MGAKNLPMYDQVGRRIKEERLRAGLTLNELAQRVGVSASYISLVENNKSIPSLKILDKICTSLSMHLSLLFMEHEERESEAFAVFRGESHFTLDVSDGRKMRILLPKDSLPLEAVQLLIRPGDRHDSFSTHEGVEFGYVARGSVEFTLVEQSGKERKIDCNAGDSLLYDAMRPHRFLNRGTVEAELLLTAVTTLSMNDRAEPR